MRLDLRSRRARRVELGPRVERVRDRGRRIVGGAGGDEIHAGEGNDTVAGDGGNDKLYGDAGNDTLDGGMDDDGIEGGDGDDTITVTRLTAINTVEVYGNAGSDTLKLTLPSGGKVITLGDHQLSTGNFVLKFDDTTDLIQYTDLSSITFLTQSSALHGCILSGHFGAYPSAELP